MTHAAETRPLRAPVAALVLAAGLWGAPAVAASGPSGEQPASHDQAGQATADETSHPEDAAAGQDEEGRAEERREASQEPMGRRYEAELSFDLLAFDNFFQAPDGAAATNIYAALTVGHLGYRVSRDLPLVVFGEIGRTFYHDLQDSTLVRGGLEYDDDLHALNLAAGFDTDRPVLDVGDEFEPANVFSLNGEYGYQITPDWELKGLLELQDQSFEVSTDKDNRILGVGPAVRYRGFGYVFSPEVGALFGGRDAVADDEDHSQTDLYLKVRSVPASPVYLSFRYRHRTRDYDTEAPLSRNFQREDTRRQLTALAVVELLPQIDLNVYYAYQDAESTLASRTFDTQLLFAGLAYVLR